MPHRCASRTTISRARLRSRASVGNMTFLGCTVVSTMMIEVFWLDRLGLGGNRKTFLQQGLQPLLAHALAPAGQRGAIEHQPVLEELLAAEELIIGVLHPALAQHL